MRINRIDFIGALDPRLLDVPGVYKRGNGHHVPASLGITEARDTGIDPDDCYEQAIRYVKPEFHDGWLREFQQEAIATAWEMGGGSIWAEPGSGKTPIAIWWALGYEADFHIVVTNNSAVYQWASQIRRFTDLDPHVWRSVSSRKKADQSLAEYACIELHKRRPGVIIVNWESLPAFWEEFSALSRQTQAITVVFDEIHRGKSPERRSWSTDEDGQLHGKELDNRAMNAERLAKASYRRLGTSASPLDNRRKDLWGQFSLIEPDCWGMTATKFFKRYCDARPGEFGGLDKSGKSNTKELKTRISNITIQIPYSVSHADVAARLRVCEVVPKELQKRRKPKDIAAMTLGLNSTSRNELLLSLAGDSKIDTIIEKVKTYLESELSKKVIIFVSRRASVELYRAALEKAVSKRGEQIEAGVLILTGSGEDSTEDRHETVKTFMASTRPERDHRVLIATYQSLGESVDLHDCDYMAVASLPLRPGEIIQMEGRVYRIGALRQTLIEYFFAEDSIDMHLRELVTSKIGDLTDLQGGSSIAGIEELLALMPHSDKLFEDYLQKLMGMT